MKIIGVYVKYVHQALHSVTMDVIGLCKPVRHEVTHLTERLITGRFHRTVSQKLKVRVLPISKWHSSHNLQAPEVQRFTSRPLIIARQLDSDHNVLQCQHMLDMVGMFQKNYDKNYPLVTSIIFQ